jgi:hypothetical protein
LTQIAGVVVETGPGVENTPSMARSSESEAPAAVAIEPLDATAFDALTRGRTGLSGSGEAGAVTVARPARPEAIPRSIGVISPMPFAARRDPGEAAQSRDTAARMGGVGNTEPPHGGSDAGPTVLRSHRSSNRSTPRARAAGRRGAHAPRRAIDDIAHLERDTIGTATTTHHPVELTSYGQIPSG